MTGKSLVVALLAAAIAPAGASAATISVTTTADSGAGSLRQAIIDAQAPGPDEIVFAPGGRGTITISTTQLPSLAADTTVTGTRTGGVPDVELHCSDPLIGTGLQPAPSATGVVVTGLSITHCTNGIFVVPGAGLTVRGAWIGQTRAGAADANTVNSIGAAAPAQLVVGGPAAGDGNLIVGGGAGIGATDAGAGVVVRGNTITGAVNNGVYLTNASGPVVQDNVVSGTGSGITLVRGAGARLLGNRVGTDAAGATAAPNSLVGINLAGTIDASVGGAAPGEGNVVSGVAGDDHCAVALQPNGDARATRTVVAGNRIGTTASGLAALTPAGFHGICVVNAVDTVVGGTAPGAGNVIGGFASSGITINNGSSGTVVRGNTIGMAVDGSGVIGNDLGIGVAADSPGTLIGGSVAGARNVVGGNRVGIYAAGPSTHVEGNLVGLAPDGRTVVGNGEGIWLNGGAADLRVGDGTPAGANVVSGNTAVGVELVTTSGAVVAGNIIGRSADGSESRPNGFYGGVRVLDSKGGVVGGDAPGDANLIDSGQNPGIRVEGDNQLGTQLLGNLLRGSPYSLGIDLLPLDVTANDLGDGDAGPNGLQNFPVLVTARTTAVDGMVNTKPATPVRIQVFSTSADRHETYALLAERNVTTDATGNATFSIPVTATLGTSVAATATTADGTSELSAAVVVAVPKPPVPIPAASFGLKRATFSIVGTKLRVRILNDTGAAARVRVGAKDTRTSLKAGKAAGTLKAVTKTIKAHRTGQFDLKLPASTRKQLAAALKRKGRATYRPTVTVKNLTSGVSKTYKPKVTATRKKGGKRR
jgi:titin